MKNDTQTCSCTNCIGAACTCGCKAPAQPSTPACRCGCQTGNTCRCADR